MAVVPTGKVKWFEVDKGFGFITSDEGEDVFLHVTALPGGMTTIKNGTRVEFSMADGRRGKQALSVVVLDAPPSVAKGRRKNEEEMATIVETLITMLDGVGNDLRRGRYPSDARAQQVAKVLRAVADDLDV